LLGWYPQDADGCPIDIKVIPNGDGTFRCSYVPTKPIKHTIIVSWGGVNVPKSPFRVRLPKLPLAHNQESQGMRAPCSRFMAVLDALHISLPQGPHKEAKTGPAEARSGELLGRVSLEPCLLPERKNPAHR
jgi:hypothetical protein